jgi:hypothetical protein
MNNHTEHHYFQFVAACIEKAISIGYEYDQNKSLQTIHEEAKEYIRNSADPDHNIKGRFDKETGTMSFYVGRQQKVIVHCPEDVEHYITDDGILYRIEA